MNPSAAEFFLEFCPEEVWL